MYLTNQYIKYLIITQYSQLKATRMLDYNEISKIFRRYQLL